MTQAGHDHELTRWRGRVALVTGASSGIGRAVARRLGRAGMKLCIAARREDRLESLAEEIRNERSGAEVLTVRCNLRDEDDIARMFAAVRDQFDGVDVLVNNAGLGRDAPLMSGETSRFREMLEVNVLALCICTREAVTDMRARGDDGHVVHISSMAAHRTPLRSGVYSATKFAVRSLTEGLRAELRAEGSKIRVTAVSPGFVETEFAKVYTGGDEEAAARTYSRFEVLQPQDVAEAVRYALAAPPRAQIHDILMRPTAQPD